MVYERERWYSKWRTGRMREREREKLGYEMGARDAIFAKLNRKFISNYLVISPVENSLHFKITLARKVEEKL
jgi:hypothetical protein